MKVSGSACMLPIFAKAPCCLELFGCCCRRLSQHGVGEVLIPLRHCWRDAFFCVCVGSGWFCHDWASHCSVFLLSFDGLFCYDLPVCTDQSSPCTNAFYCLCFAQDQALVQYRPNQRKQMSFDGLLLFGFPPSPRLLTHAIRRAL